MQDALLLFRPSPSLLQPPTKVRVGGVDSSEAALDGALRNVVKIVAPSAWHDVCSSPKDSSSRERMIDLDLVFTTGRAAFFALNGIVIALIAVYVLARPR